VDGEAAISGTTRSTNRPVMAQRRHIPTQARTLGAKAVDTAGVGGSRAAANSEARTPSTTEACEFVFFRKQTDNVMLACLRQQSDSHTAARRRIFERFKTFCANDARPHTAMNVIAFLSCGLLEHEWVTATLASYRSLLLQCIQLYETDTAENIAAVKNLPLKGRDPTAEKVWEKRSAQVLSKQKVAAALSSDIEAKAFAELLLLCAGRAADVLPSFDGECGIDVLCFENVCSPQTFLSHPQQLRIDFSGKTKAMHSTAASSTQREDHLCIVFVSEDVAKFLTRKAAGVGAPGRVARRSGVLRINFALAGGALPQLVNTPRSCHDHRHLGVYQWFALAGLRLASVFASSLSGPFRSWRIRKGMSSRL
jgi:hypothetical protein